MKKTHFKKILFIVATAALALGVSLACALFAIKGAYPLDYGHAVERYSDEFSVPSYVVYSVIKVESGFDKDAVSEKGACGLMQLMPETYAWLAEMRGEVAGDVFDPEENIKYGTFYLSFLYERYGNWTHALCAYNAGMGNVDRWLLEKPFEIPFEETQNYVNKLEVAIERYRRLCHG